MNHVPDSQLAFALHFEQLTGFPPLSWQARLFDEYFAQGHVPSAVDIPTGLGKTAVMALWLLARASGAPLPRRLVYVVDRRAVVDQATRFAELLRNRLDSHAASLKAGLQLNDRSLPISTLRGQYVDNREWLEDPSQAAIIVGTVDMIGSRLLFEGYGVSRKMRPYHAGLLGVDTLVLLDEAHLVPSFERLIERIASGIDANGRTFRPADSSLAALVPPLRFLSLSATGRDRKDEHVFGLTSADVQHPVVKQRLSAAKGLVLQGEVAEKDLADALAAHAWALTDSGARAARVIVFCTSRDDAQKVQLALHRLSPAVGSIDTELFVGGRRVYERENAAHWLEERGFIADNDKKPACATFVIATAAGEVGVDLDADHAACDLVAWERMVQRLGRVNRRGDGDATVVVVPVNTEDEHEKKRRDAVLKLLHALPCIRDGVFDVSPGALAALKANSELDSLRMRANTPAPLHPTLTRALVEAWSMTSLEEHTGRPEVEPWIRGWPDEEQLPQTTVVWRTYLPITDDGRLFSKQDLEAFRDAADPHLAERLETETWRVLDWLGKRIKTLQEPRPEDADLELNERPLRRNDVLGVILDPPSGRERIIQAKDFSTERKRDTERALRGATLLVDRRLLGLENGLLKDDAEAVVVDVTEVEAESVERVVPFRIRRLIDLDDERAPSGWRTEASIALNLIEEGDAAWLVVESLAGKVAGSEEGRSGAKRAQRLDQHQEWAESAALRVAGALALTPEFTELLSVSARLHDEGKQVERWQRAFNAPGGGHPPYAKTTSRPNLAILDGYRHELGSLPYAEMHARVKALPPALRELCLHLIAAHHGGARPLIRTSAAPEPPSRLVDRAREIALRFTELQKTWGPWGLAWWEALLRAADQQASRRNDQEGDSSG